MWKKIPRSTAVDNGWKVISAKWIDTNKGDDDKPLIRSRYVGKEFNNGPIDGLFAGTPPLEALRTLVSDAATVEMGFVPRLDLESVRRGIVAGPTDAGKVPKKEER